MYPMEILQKERNVHWGRDLKRDSYEKKREKGLTNTLY